MAPHAHETYSGSLKPGHGTDTECPPLQCPSCGGLQCLCRPRFFAGQLLTEQDLWRLEQYIIEKNKLHNRYLHGWGIVCGLDVTKSKCEGHLHVAGGYALSPCGDDIIVCCDKEVAVCDLINACRDLERSGCESPCGPVVPPAGSRETWRLLVCYDEKPSRGITALRGGSGASCCSRCACGGSSQCGCGCHPKGNGHSTRRPLPPPVCEPTLTCEAFKFAVCRVEEKPPPLHNPKLIPWQILVDNVNAAKWSKVSKAAAVDAATKAHAYLAKFASTYIGADKELNDLIAAAAPKAEGLSTDEFVTSMQKAFVPPIKKMLIYGWHWSMRPPCPPPGGEPCVVLATFTVEAPGCKIVDLKEADRTYVPTVPNLIYWSKATPTQPSFAGLVKYIEEFIGI